VNTPYTVTFAVSANAPATGTPTGTVTVTDGTGASCTATVAQGSCTLTSTTAGTKMVSATYNGDANFNPSTSAGFQHVVSGVQGPVGDGFEGDIDRTQPGTPGTGNGVVDLIDIFWFDQFARLLHCPAEVPNEFQRLDGNDNGFIDGGDYNVIFNTFLGLQLKVQAKGTPTRPAGLCTGVPTKPEESDGEEVSKASPDDETRQITRGLRVVSAEGQSGKDVLVSIELDALGDEMSTSTTIRFDPNVLSIDGTSGIDVNPDVMRGEHSAKAQRIGVNATDVANGILGIAVDFSNGTGRSVTRGTRQIITLRFHLREDLPPGAYSPIELTDTLIPQQTVDSKGEAIKLDHHNGVVIVIQQDVRSLVSLFIRPTSGLMGL
jgi:hypothetical protein